MANDTVENESMLSKTRSATSELGTGSEALASTLSSAASAVAALAPGTRFAQYELIRELGRGGMGIVFVARDLRLVRRVAIKFLHHVSTEIAQRFMIEARATARCTHDNIVVIHEVGEHDGKPYLVFEYLEGHTLRGKLGRAPVATRLPASRVVELALPIARALARANELGIVHRDLKPENVFVTSSGQVKVLDFGIAKAIGQRETIEAIRDIPDSSLASTLTNHGALVGTLPYMSPEQVRAADVDHRSDLWALGIMMFEMLAGRHPVQPLDRDALIASATSAESLPSIASIVRDVPPGLARLVDGCLRKSKSERIATASDVVRRLEALLPERQARGLAEGESPYPGLMAFQERDADRFFGRSREIGRMVALLRDRPLAAVVGPSGAGKSSFVRAGLAPALKACGERWEMVALRPGRRPLSALASMVERLDGSEAEQDKLLAQLRSDPGCLGDRLRARVRATGQQILVFVDQLEELYTLGADASERLAFTNALASVADDTAAPLRVVLAMRSDFLDRLAEHPHFVEDVSAALLVLGATDEAGLRDALVQPAAMEGYQFESAALVDEMLGELRDTPAGALPLLQFAATTLWEHRDRERKQLTVASYRASGGVTGALATHADRVIESLTAPARALARRIFRQLVTPERTRAIAELADLEQLANSGEAQRVVSRLVQARLLVVQKRTDGGATVEIVHESLIDRWPMLSRWLDEDQEDAAYLAQLATAAKQWDAMQQAPGLLWRGEAIEDARRWYSQRPRELGNREQAFLDAAFAAARRSKRARRIGASAAFIVLASIAAGASIAYVRVDRAEREATRALVEKTAEERARRDAEAKKLAALAALLTADQRAAAAEAGLLTAEQVAAAARKAAEAAETALRDAQQSRDVLAGELARAEQERAQITAKAATERAAAAHVVELTREQLVANNAQLETALATAKTARERAERETARAEAARVEAEQAKVALQQALAVEKARADKLENERRKISTKLK